MQSPPRWCCRQARLKNPTTVQRKIHCRYLIIRREEAGHYKRQRAAGNRPRSMRPNASRGVAPHRQDRQAGKSAREAAVTQSLLRRVRVEDRARGGLRTSSDSARFADFAQISPAEWLFRKCMKGVISVACGVIGRGKSVNAREMFNAAVMMSSASRIPRAPAVAQVASRLRTS